MTNWKVLHENVSGCRVRNGGGRVTVRERDRGGSEAECQEGRREGRSSVPTLCWFPQRPGLIPVLIGGEFQCTCSPGMSVERGERGSGACDPSDGPQQCASALCWNINTPPGCRHVGGRNGFTSFCVSFSFHSIRNKFKWLSAAVAPQRHGGRSAGVCPKRFFYKC